MTMSRDVFYAGKSSGQAKWMVRSEQAIVWNYVIENLSACAKKWTQAYR
jgi:hypothetical protein